MASTILVVTLVEYLIHDVFLYTQIFSGPQQFVIQIIFNNIIPDIYLTMYIPCMWIRASILANWCGWGKKDTTLLKFQYVRRPDPREELKRKGYFKKKNRFQYKQKDTNIADIFIKNRINNLGGLSTYLICEPYNGGKKVQSTKEMKMWTTKQITLNDQICYLDIPSRCSSSMSMRTDDNQKMVTNESVTIRPSLGYVLKATPNVSYHCEKGNRREQGQIGIFGVN